MKFIVIGLCSFLIHGNLCYETKKNTTLILSHIIFRHGDRTPEKIIKAEYNQLFTEEDFYPYGLGQLNQKGKRRMYNLGRNLHMRYKNFLGDVYYHGIVEATASFFERSQTSLQLLLAGLFPTTKPYNLPGRLRWQPIPYKILEYDKDNILGLIGWCPEPIFGFPFKIDNAAKSMIADIVFENIGKNLTHAAQVMQLNDLLLTQVENGVDIPNWAKDLFPDPLGLISQKVFGELVKFELCNISGHLLKKILSDTYKRINETSRHYKKLHIYSGHDINLIGLLVATENWKNIRVKYSSYMLLELHKIDGIFGFKVYYYNYETYKPKLLRINGCGKFCPLEYFQKLVEKIYVRCTCKQNK